MGHLRTCGAVLILLAGTPPLRENQGKEAAPPADSKPRADTKPFADGIRLDWTRRLVEVDGEVVLREGPLELLACSPNTREHESILRIFARPMRIYQAMGLLGMEPGAPVHYDEAAKKLRPPQGERLDLRVRYRDGTADKTVAVERWLRKNEDGDSPESLDWVFAGATTRPDGIFTADLEGTVVCVVDFETAVIALSSLHTADNEALWLSVNTEAIPPAGTPVTLLIRSAKSISIVVHLDEDGKFRVDGKRVSAAGVVRAAHQDADGRRCFRVTLSPLASISNDLLDAAVNSLVQAGLAKDAIEVRRNLPSAGPDRPNGGA